MQGTYTPTYTSWVVQLSIGLAVLVSYTALRLAGRTTHAREHALVWLTGGALAMGIGMWSVHFLSMLSLRLPIQLTYDVASLAISLIVAVMTAGFALAFIRRPRPGTLQLLSAATLLGCGMATTHYLGMASIRIVPSLSYDPSLFATSVAIAILASLASLWLMFRLRTCGGVRESLSRAGAALLMGGAVSGMNHVAMSAVGFRQNSFCLPGATIDNNGFALLLAVFAFGLLAITLLTLVYDSHMERRIRERPAAHPVNAGARYATTHDALTGLPNRLAVLEVAGETIAKSRSAETRFALLVLNVDRLKSVNDSLGHEAGDRLLCELAARLRAVLRRGDVLGRLAGDEFTVLAREIHDAHDAQIVIDKVQAAVAKPFAIGTQDVHVSLGIGVSMYPQDGPTFELLLRRAETAMRYAKHSARGSFRLYAAEMSSVADERWALETDLRHALALGQLEVHYQPKVDIATNRVRSAEALIRWRHPVRGLVPPGVFIPVAEETGLIVAIGEWVLREACRQVRAWLDAGVSPVRIAVNLSARQFRDHDLAAVVRCALEDARLEPGYLELELTESAVMHDAEQSAATLETLSTMGVHISIDDFGTGYSSLSHLRRFPLDKLKIDRSFVRELLSNPDDVAIVTAIISLAHGLRLRVVAEGVETADQLQFLRDLGCDQYQGFYCSPAVPPDEFATLLQRLRERSQPEFTEADMLRTQSRLSAFTSGPSI
jgi:diguanylate cyclase